MQVNRSRIAKKTKSIVNGFSSGAFVPVDLSGAPMDCKRASVGTLVANTLANIVTETNKAGTLWVCGIYNAEAMSKTQRLQVIVDGVIVFDNTCNANSTLGNGFCAAGRVDATAKTLVDGVPVYFTNSLVVNAASSTSGSSNLQYLLKYTIEAV